MGFYSKMLSIFDEINELKSIQKEYVFLKFLSSNEEYDSIIDSISLEIFRLHNMVEKIHIGAGK